MRSGGHPDGTQEAIVLVLRKVGATVQIITQVGNGCPDLLVGFRGRTFLLEVKSESGALQENQVRWHRLWNGLPVEVVVTPLQALQAIGAVRRAA